MPQVDYAALAGHFGGRPAATAPPTDDEARFRAWTRTNQITDADSPESFYDYRAAFRAGATRDASGHWPSDFKKPGHPNEIVGGFNTRTGKRVPGTPRAQSAAELTSLGWDPQTAARLASTPDALDYAALAREMGGAPADARPSRPATSPPAAATRDMMLQDTMHDRPSPVAPNRRDQVHAAFADEDRRIANDPLKQVGVGMEKGFENTILGVADLWGRVGVGDRNAVAAARRINEPTNTAQKVGYGVEQVGEFIALPTGKGTLLRRVAQEGVESGALSAAQGGDPALGVAGGVAGPVVSRVVGAAAARGVPALREAAAKRVTQALGPTKERFKALATRITPEILRRGLSGSREAILARATQAADDAGSQIDEAIQAYGQRQVNTAPVIDALETAKDAFRTTQQMTAQQAAARGLAPQARDIGNGMVAIDVVFEPRTVKQLNGLQRIIGQLGDSATVEQLVAVRRAWGKVVDRAGGFAHRAGGAIGVPLSDQTEAWAKREAVGAIRLMLNSDVPELSALNKEFAFWKTLDDVLTQTVQRTQPQQRGVGRIAAEAAGQVVGGVAGSTAGPAGAVGGALLVGKLAEAAKAAFTSPRWRLLDARMRNHLADAIASGNTTAVTGALARVNAALMSGGALRPVPSH